MINRTERRVERTSRPLINVSRDPGLSDGFVLASSCVPMSSECGIDGKKKNFLGKQKDREMII